MGEAECESESKKRYILMDPVAADLFQTRHNATSSTKKGKKDMGNRKRGGYGEERRRLLKKDLLKLVEGFGVEYGKKKLVATYSLQTGLTPRKIEEYLYELVDANILEIEGNTISLLRLVEKEAPEK